MSILNVLVGVGMTTSWPKVDHAGPPQALPVLLDGCVIGSLSSGEADKVVAHLRSLKVSDASVIPDDLEVGYVPLSLGGTYPGLYLFASPSRFIRPVRNISIPSTDEKDIELIGPFEQVFMEIKCPDGRDGGRSTTFPATHEEILPTAMLSVVANLTPWSDHNQSPRNMYQCQMAKQTMAFSLQALHSRADQKLYHLQTPQTPIVRTKTYTKYCLDNYPSGTNAIVAVLAYTGYDMEDAMILNKSSVERGMCHGQIYQTETIDLCDGKSKSDRGQRIFKREHSDKAISSFVDSDGLPYIGQVIHGNEPYCSTINQVTNAKRTYSRKGSETAIVDYVSVDAKNKNNLQKVNIRFRHPRNPVIGDKFSRRHGQKGVCSQLWPDIGMPFSGVTGMRPDLIINPHAFPSRMTVAMLMESVAAKGGRLHGKFVDATPFSDSVKGADGETEESVSLVDELGSMLRARGFIIMELRCYTVVRATGQVDQITRQPIKGRKRGGGIRFGEMERDSMLSHGAAYLLHDRLQTCSDYHIGDVCSLCGSILTTAVIPRPGLGAQENCKVYPCTQQRDLGNCKAYHCTQQRDLVNCKAYLCTQQRDMRNCKAYLRTQQRDLPQKRVVREIGGLPPARAPKKVMCHGCQTSKGMESVAMSYVFRYLAAELAAMNIKMTVQLSSGAGA
ncbi:DNA-directed RNA polymerase I subunit RPA2-like isoform X2 [Hibiscus syriacus]|uniref:DNA-directed RNA polymerase n=1 Tax=Hibiscus syriacus TaxID=106335 RepID=A0A6A2Y481_HIBSY|nr:DNA-directed RNA polymerase I subunit RPA2-like isoform X2 [Hibiscus syriacus]